MIRSVGVGGSNVSNQQRRTPKTPETPFPQIPNLNKEPLNEPAQDKPLLVGVKANPLVRSILEEEQGYMRQNADGDRLEVSKKAITLAKERFAAIN